MERHRRPAPRPRPSEAAVYYTVAIHTLVCGCLKIRATRSRTINREDSVGQWAQLRENKDLLVSPIIPIYL
jgi:hypothetical protein